MHGVYSPSHLMGLTFEQHRIFGWEMMMEGMAIFLQSFRFFDGATEAFDCTEVERHRNWQS